MSSGNMLESQFWSVSIEEEPWEWAMMWDSKTRFDGLCFEAGASMTQDALSTFRDSRDATPLTLNKPIMTKTETK